MTILFSYTSILFFIIVVFFIKVSGNDKAVFLILLPMIYSLVLTVYYLVTIIRSYNMGIDKILYFDIFIAIAPIIYTLIIILLAGKGIVDSMLFLGFR
ncbi:MAG: hypothetical protein COA79_17960 [Planctomycetota bacterium]|nr:MAG: hypothetical protein COA79_17960 [Planctomycetota bacterium]